MGDNEQRNENESMLETGSYLASNLRNKDGSSRKTTGEDKSGDLLRKERIKKRIAVETIARDLKINAQYIKSIEDNRYNELPSAPYIRVYLRSMAKYLLLDPEDILKKYYDEQGVSSDKPEGTGENKIEISMKKSESGKLKWVILLGILILLAIVGRFVLKTDFTSGTGEMPTTQPDSTENIEKSDSLSIIETDSFELEDMTDSLTSENNEDSLEEDAQIKPEKMRLSIKAIKDSVWVQVYSDGNSWRNFIYANSTRVFAARDSFNVHVGQNTNLSYSLDGKPITSIKGRGVVTFRIDRDNIEKWSLSKWKKVFNQ